MKYFKYLILSLSLFYFGCGIFYYRNNTNNIKIEMQTHDFKATTTEDFIVSNDLNFSYINTNTHNGNTKKQKFKIAQDKFNEMLKIIDLDNSNNNYIIEKRGFFDIDLMYTRVKISRANKVICNQHIAENQNLIALVERQTLND